MADTPSILIVDDGELDRVERLLVKAGFDPARIRASRIRQSIEKPRDLLVMSWHPVRELPQLHDNPSGLQPIRVCVHSQDFLPLRERLRGLGVDYLVQTALDDDSLRLFLCTLLYRGPERRAERRLPLGGQVTLDGDGETERVKLAELARTGCRVICGREWPPDTPVSVVLPKGLEGDDALALSGRVTRSDSEPGRGARSLWSCVIAFDALPESAQRQLDRIAEGGQIGTRATPLRPAKSAGEGDRDTAAPAQVGAAEERRGDARACYERQVVLLGVDDVERTEVLLGRDLSSSGLRAVGTDDPPVGAAVTLALGGAARTEPVIVEATVVRAAGGEAGLRLGALSEAQRAGIGRLLGGPSTIERLRGEDGARRVIVGRALAR